MRLLSMNKANLILFIHLLKPSLILMLNNYRSLRSNEYFIDTCCSLSNENQQINLSCRQNEKIQLNLIEIFYNPNEYCSSEYSCCKYRTNCSRRITKYSKLNCNDKNFCSIDKTCLKIHEPCASIYGLYGQYMTISYSCLPANKTYDIINRTYSMDADHDAPFILKLLTSEQTSNGKSMVEKNFLISNQLKSSPLSLISMIFIFLLLTLIIYSLADQIGNKICRKNNSKQTKTTKINQILLEHTPEERCQVESTYPNHMRDASTHDMVCQCHRPYYNYDYRDKYPYVYYPVNPYEKYIHIQHHPTTGQIYSTTYNPYFNQYTN